MTRSKDFSIACLNARIWKLLKKRDRIEYLLRQATHIPGEFCAPGLNIFSLGIVKVGFSSGGMRNARPEIRKPSGPCGRKQ